jgi:release factor glutamine methyltransferase
MIWDVLSAHRHLTGHLSKSGVESPRIAAEILLSHVLGMDRIGIYSRYDEPVSRDRLDEVNALSRRLVAGEPLQLVVGNTQFMSYVFEVERGALIPRPETEVLVEKTVAHLEAAGMNRAPLLCDIGAGAGVIAISLLKLLPSAHAVATDPSALAAALTQRNAERLGVADRIQIVQAPYFGAADSPASGPFDAVISNPPYIRTGDIAGLDPVVRDYDPHTALDGGPDGFAVIREIIRLAPEHLAPGGMLGLEVGMGQAGETAEIMRAADFSDITVHRDLADIERCVFGRLQARSSP